MFLRNNYSCIICALRQGDNNIFTSCFFIVMMYSCDVLQKLLDIENKQIIYYLSYDGQNITEILCLIQKKVKFLKVDLATV